MISKLRRAVTFCLLLLLGIGATPKAYADFTFSAVGDFGGGTNFKNSLDTILGINQGRTGLASGSFTIALGDFSYQSSQTYDPTWANTVRSKLYGADYATNSNSIYPFELIPGNHDTLNYALDSAGQPVGMNVFNGFNNDLKDHIYNYGTNPTSMPAGNGVYGKQYYFDYPLINPIARFILVSPGDNILGNSNRYLADTAAADPYRCDNSGATANYNWTCARISEAKNAGLWVVVAMHETCITAGDKKCDLTSGIGPNLLNLLVEKKVDLVLQGHEHNYQRTKQLSFNGALCPKFTTNSSVVNYNADCVVSGIDGTSSHPYTRGSGTVIVIAGMGGITEYGIHPTYVPFGYLQSYMGLSGYAGSVGNYDGVLYNNYFTQFGVMKFFVTSTQITGEFVPNTGSFYKDKFYYVSSGATPNPTTTPLPPSSTPTQTPSLAPTRTPTPAISRTPTPTPIPSCTNWPQTDVAVFNLTVPTSTSYNLWFQMMAGGDVSTNTLRAQLYSTDGCILDKNIDAPSSLGWIRVNDSISPSILSSINGKSYTLKLYPVESGVKFYSALLTSNLACIPTNTDPDCTSAVAAMTPTATATRTPTPSSTPAPVISLTPTSAPIPTKTPTPTVPKAPPTVTPADLIAPVVSVDNPINGSVYQVKNGQHIKVTTSARDNSGNVLSLNIIIDGQIRYTCSNTTVCSFTWKMNQIPSGTAAHILKATAKDAAGNMGASSEVQITIRK